MTVPPAPRLGFIGLGRMGQVMAGRLADAGYAVRGHDADPGARARLAGRGIELAGSATEAAEGASAVILMLPDSPAVRHVLVDDGLLQAVAPGTVIIDMGSSDPEETRTLAGLAGQRAVSLIDAPVSGGVAGAVAGTLTIMVGGPANYVTELRPVFDALGSKIVHVGPVGSGHALKALNNLLVATTLLASCETLEIARRFGIDPDVFVDTVNGSTGRSHSTEVKLSRFVLSGTFDSGFALRLLVKDAQTAVRLAQSLGGHAELGEATLALWERAAADLPSDADHTEIDRLLRSPDDAAPAVPRAEGRQATTPKGNR